MFRPVGDRALTLELGAGARTRLRSIAQRLAQQPFAGLLEAVPTVGALLVVYAPESVSYDAIRARLARLLEEPLAPAPPARLHEIPTLYGGEHGPDLGELAQRSGLTPQQVVALHSGQEYEALMLGFMPGFAYLGPLPHELRVPRRATPRTRVAAGSVAVAADRTGIYPAASPGGWHLIGRTDLTLFDPRRQPPVLIEPGDRVRFVPVRELRARPDGLESYAHPRPVALVLDGGLLTTVQDLGRPGFRRYGVSASGALDPPALAAANRALGNPENAAGLECTLVGPRLRFLETTRLALAGADLGAELQRADLGPWPVPRGTPVLARAGSLLTFGERRSGARAYVAFAGGLDVPVCLGSRSTDVKAGFGGLDGRPLRAGDRLGVGARVEDAARGEVLRGASASEPLELELRVVLGPQDGLFEPRAIEALLGEPYTLSSDSDRFGARLVGTPLAHAGPGEIESDGLVPGCIQVPPDGRPIVALAEGPTTGGYPKIATLVSADVARLAQALPGVTRLRFRALAARELELLGG